jgi:hypothetical protein
MSIPNLVPLLGSISGMLAGPELAQRAASALGIAGTPAGNLVAAASPKAIGAGIASLGAGAGVDDAVRQALSVSGAEAGNLGQAPQIVMPKPAAQMPMSQAPQMPMGQPPVPMPMGQPPAQMPMTHPPAQMPMTQVPQTPQPAMQNAFPQAQQQPASLNTGLGTLRPQQGPAMGPMTKGFV